MSERKTPILLRRGPMSGEIQAIYRYTWDRKRDRITAHGKQSVQADFDVLMLEALLDPDSPDIAELLDSAAKGIKLTAPERKQVRAFRERLVAIIERHNARSKS